MYKYRFRPPHAHTILDDATPPSLRHILYRLKQHMEAKGKEGGGNAIVERYLAVKKSHLKLSPGRLESHAVELEIGNLQRKIFSVLLSYMHSPSN